MPERVGDRRLPEGRVVFTGCGRRSTRPDRRQGDPGARGGALAAGSRPARRRQPRGRDVHGARGGARVLRSRLARPGEGGEHARRGGRRGPRRHAGGGGSDCPPRATRLRASPWPRCAVRTSPGCPPPFEHVLGQTRSPVSGHDRMAIVGARRAIPHGARGDAELREGVHVAAEAPAPHRADPPRPPGRDGRGRARLSSSRARAVPPSGLRTPFGRSAGAALDHARPDRAPGRGRGSLPAPHRRPGQEDRGIDPDMIRWDEPRWDAGRKSSPARAAPTPQAKPTGDLGGVERGGRVRAEVVPNSGIFSIIEPWHRRTSCPARWSFTIGSQVYTGLGEKSYTHRRINHSARVYVDEGRLAARRPSRRLLRPVQVGCARSAFRHLAQVAPGLPRTEWTWRSDRARVRNAHVHRPLDRGRERDGLALPGLGCLAESVRRVLALGRGISNPLGVVCFGSCFLSVTHGGEVGAWQRQSQT